MFLNSVRRLTHYQKNKRQKIKNPSQEKEKWQPSTSINHQPSTMNMNMNHDQPVDAE